MTDTYTFKIYRHDRPEELTIEAKLFNDDQCAEIEQAVNDKIDMTKMKMLTDKLFKEVIITVNGESLADNAEKYHQMFESAEWFSAMVLEKIILKTQDETGRPKFG